MVSTTTPSHSKSINNLTLAALGVVYGDIGTSPLYTLRECFTGHHPLALTHANILGVLSLILWALIIVVTLKYVFFIMRADNHGEGGILALLALARSTGLKNNTFKGALALTGMFGASLFYGDGVITPAISVLSAVEGLELAAPNLHQFTIPIALTILIGLFAFQHKGTDRVGALFGPVMLLWFSCLAMLGAISVIQHPRIFYAINPYHAYTFFCDHGFGSLLVFGAVVLAVTGGEALYADMGHFGRKPIQRAWLMLVFPALVLNYFGQGALLLDHPEAINNPFYSLAPTWFLWPLLILATCATIIASQAVISGVFSVTRQAVQMGFWPRLKIIHTSSHEIGQIYIPLINWTLMLAVIFLILQFRTSSSMASAYGIAVTMAMMVDTMLACFVAIQLWRWSKPLVFCIFIGFFTVDAMFLMPNLLKIPDGGWAPLLIGITLMFLMFTWRTGRRFVTDTLNKEGLPLTAFLSNLANDRPMTVHGTAIFMVRNPDQVPHALLHNLKHNKVLHSRVVLLTISTEEVPVVSLEERISIEKLGPQVYIVHGYYGFQESPDVPSLLELCSTKDLYFNMMDTSFFLSREHLIPRKHKGMPPIMDKIFSLMMRNSNSITDYFNIPPNRVVELGTQVEI